MKRMLLSSIFAASLITLAVAQNQRWSLEEASQPYKGTKLTMVTVAWTDAIKTIAADFTKKTGITVEVVQIPGGTILEKTLLELRNKGTSFDLYTAGYKRPFTAAKVVNALNPYLANVKLADPNFNREDFVRFNNIAVDPDSPGNVLAIPFGAGGMAVYYRKDLFASATHRNAFKAKYKRELAPPRSMNELEQVAAYFSDADWKSFSGAKGVGIAFQGTRAGDNLMWHFALQAAGRALENNKVLPALLDRSNNLTFTNYSRSSLEAVQRLFKHAQSGALQADDTAVRDLFVAGGAAMVLTWDSFIGRLGSGEIANKWALAAMPGRTLLGQWSLQLNPYSKNQDAAFLLAQFLSNKESDLKMFELAGRYPARSSTYSTEQYKSKNPYGEIFAQSKGRGMLQVDNVATSQVNSVIAEAVSQMLAGQLTPAAADEKLRGNIEQVLIDSGLR
jgi:multiple sugar transport system substrate-binding protein